MSHLFNISMDLLLYVSTCELGYHQAPSMIYNPTY
jgi:hypothetical protein